MLKVWVWVSSRVRRLKVGVEYNNNIKKISCCFPESLSGAPWCPPLSTPIN